MTLTPRQTAVVSLALLLAIALLLWPVALLCAGQQGQLTISSTTGKRPYKILADVPRGAWFRNAAFDDESDRLGLSWGSRHWSVVVAVDHVAGTVELTDRRRVTPAQLSAGWVFTRDPFAPVPVEYPCLLNSEQGDGL